MGVDLRQTESRARMIVLAIRHRAITTGKMDVDLLQRRRAVVRIGLDFLQAKRIAERMGLDLLHRGIAAKRVVLDNLVMVSTAKRMGLNLLQMLLIPGRPITCINLALQQMSLQSYSCVILKQEAPKPKSVL